MGIEDEKGILGSHSLVEASDKLQHKVRSLAIRNVLLMHQRISVHYANERSTVECALYDPVYMGSRKSNIILATGRDQWLPRPERGEETNWEGAQGNPSGWWKAYHRHRYARVSTFVKTYMGTLCCI